MTELNGQYVRVGYRRVALLFDLANGHAFGKKDIGVGYVWVFPSYQDAMRHRRIQHRKKRNARLSMPVVVDIRNNKRLGL